MTSMSVLLAVGLMLSAVPGQLVPKRCYQDDARIIV